MWWQKKKRRKGFQQASLDLLEKLARQSNASPSVEQPQAAAPAHPLISDSMKSAAKAGWVIIFLFFGVFGTWAAFAPLHGAVVANGVVKVEGNRKSIQHLDGGIVKQLRVKEGDQVKAGDVVLVLDDNQARAEYDVLSQQYLVLRATEERLKAELGGSSALTMPADFKEPAKDPSVIAIWKGQVSQFESRQAAIAGQRSVLREKIAQLESQIKGAEAQVKSFETQYVSVQKELESIAPLVQQGLIARPRYLQLERSGSALEGQAADTRASIAKFRQAIAEQVQQIAQLDNDRMTDVTKDLRDTQAKLLEVIPRRANAQAVLGRIEIRAPYAGRVVALSVFSVGGVINRGDKIMDIVPERDALIIEAQIAVEDISEVHPQMRADIHLTAYKQRITPVVRGEVVDISADRLTDPKTGAPYYVALVRINEREFETLPDTVRLYPGMPTNVMIPTVERTALDYLLNPLTSSFSHSFRQK